MAEENETTGGAVPPLPEIQNLRNDLLAWESRVRASYERQSADRD